MVEQLPCPNQKITVQCQIMVPTTSLTWTLPSDDSLEFGVLQNVNDVRNSSNNIYSATLTGRAEDNDPNTDLFFFTSTLLVLDPVNGSTLTCGGAAAGNQVENSIEIELHGMYHVKSWMFNT